MLALALPAQAKWNSVHGISGVEYSQTCDADWTKQWGFGFDIQLQQNGCCWIYYSPASSWGGAKRYAKKIRIAWKDKPYSSYISGVFVRNGDGPVLFEDYTVRQSDFDNGSIDTINMGEKIFFSQAAVIGIQACGGSSGTGADRIVRIRAVGINWVKGP
jgi:hypothetical protein